MKITDILIAEPFRNAEDLQRTLWDCGELAPRVKTRIVSFACPDENWRKGHGR